MPPLEPEDVSLYRSVAMRAAYLSMDRPDIQCIRRELAKAMASPTQRHMTALKRLARYLRVKPRLVQNFEYQEAVSEIVCWANAGHAGCVRTRKSTSGGVLMHGKHVLKTYSKGQAVIALSSAEAECYGVVSAASHLLGETSLAQARGIKLLPRIYMDATAGIAIGSRRGWVKSSTSTSCSCGSRA